MNINAKNYIFNKKKYLKRTDIKKKLKTELQPLYRFGEDGNNVQAR